MSNDNQDAESIISVDDELDTLREGVDDPQVLKAQLAKEAQARRQLTARTKNSEAELKTLKAKLAELESGTDDTTISQQPTAADDERLELRLDGYSKEEVAYIMANGGRKSLDDQSSFTAIAINTKREQRQAEIAASQTDTSGGEDNLRPVDFKLPKNPTAADLKKSIADMEKALPHAE